MKFRYFIFFLVLILFSSEVILSQGYNWITPNKTYLKMYVVSDGMIRLNRSDFTNAGINTSIIDPRTVKIFNNGIQIPVYFFGEQDGVFNDSDYIDFYGKRNYGGLVTTYDQNNNFAYSTNEYFNQYSDTNVYWAGWDGTQGLRFSETNFNSSVNYPADFFYAPLHLEKDKIYSQGENLSSSDYRFLSTEKFKGEGWYWSLLYNNQTVGDTFSLPMLYNTPQNVSIKLFAYPQNFTSDIFNEHSLQITINGSPAGTLYTNDMNRIDTILNFSSSLLHSESINSIEVRYSSAPGFSGAMYFDYCELSYPKQFKFYGDKLSWNLNNSDTTSKYFKVSGFNPVNRIFIYDIKNNFRITNYSYSSDTLKFTSKNNSQIELINDRITKKPFRIKQKQVPDFLASANGADYLLIYPSLFSIPAEQLRSYRQTHDNFRSVKAEVEDITDVFNYGLENPVAMKRFIKNIYDTWQLPKLKYVCLFGRGSLDPKQILPTSIYYKNYIPVYGYPNSDGYFAHLNNGFYYSDNISIGRIPAYYPAEAQTMVDKIVSYETQTPDKWWKTFTYITGGGTFNEQQSHQQRSNYEINTFVSSTKISGTGIKIYRNDTSGITTYNISDSVKNTFNRGTLYVNFRGHAGSHDWEVIMNDPNTLNNGTKLPLVLSLTCFTGENAKPDFRGFGEKFVYLPNKGAIGFIGTTGWSFSSSGNDFGTYIIQNLQRDSARRIGDFLVEAGFRMIGDSSSFNTRHTVNNYNLLGDPAAKLVLPRYPEFVITQSDYKLSEDNPMQSEPVTLTIFPKNYGLYADSCRIRFQLRKYNQDYSFKDTLYKSFRFMDTVKYNFRLDSSGNYQMVVTLDVDNRYPLEDNSNNSITINLTSKNNTFIPLSPVNNALVYKDTVELKGLNPNIKYRGNNIKVLLKLDTSKTFNSPVGRTFIYNSISSSVTKFKTNLPVTLNNTIYYWKTCSVINNDTSGWSVIQNFIYNTGTSGTNNLLRYINAYQNVTTQFFSPNQYNESQFFNTGFVNNEIRLNEYPARLFVRSLGSNAEEASYFSVGNNNIYIDGGQNVGLNMLKVKKLSGKIEQFKNFRVNSPATSDTIVSFLNTFDSTHYLMLLNAAYDPGTSTLTSAAKNKLRQFGSIYCDSIHLVGYFHTWSFIGFLGADHSQVSEMFDPCCRTTPTCTGCDHWMESISTMDVIFKQPFGTVSNIIGPASLWKDFTWTQTIAPGSNILFDIYGIDRNNQQVILFPDVQTNYFGELSKIPAIDYPKLNFVAKLYIDSTNGTQSPALKSIKVNYSPASELVMDANSFTYNFTDRQQSANFSFNYYNGGFAYIYGLIVKVSNISGSDSSLIFTDTVNNVIEFDSTKSYSAAFSVPSFRDSTRFSVSIIPRDRSNEFYYYNNYIDFTIHSAQNASLSVIDVFSDGKLIKSGDNLRKNPEIKISIREKDTKDLNYDTSRISLCINNIHIPYPAGNTLYRKDIKDYKKDVEDNSEFLFYPEFRTGVNRLSVIYKIINEEYDTLNYDVNVNGTFGISDLYNYPNPVKSETNFMFNLTGSDNPSGFKIKIYTVTGRLIKEINYPAVIGYNSIYWDTKDNDGEFVANGTYLYKIVTDDKDFTETEIQKLVILK